MFFVGINFQIDTVFIFWYNEHCVIFILKGVLFMSPKMSEEYYEQKRKQILAATFAVCMRKPMHEVSMRDVISEVKFSQGNIYRYYANLDEILIDLINARRIVYDVKAEVDTTLLSDLPPERIISLLFEIWEKAILDNILGVGKIFYEVCAMYINDTDRLMNFVNQNDISKDEEYFKKQGLGFVMQQVMEGYFQPKLPIEDIFNFLGTSFDGIIRDLIIITHYETPMFPPVNKSRLVKSLCTAFILLLGGNERLIYPEENFTS